MDTTNIILLVTIFVLNLLVYINIKVRKDSPQSENEFVISETVLVNIISLYKEVILSPKVESLKRQYDLNERSQTNSIKAYQKALNDLVSESSKEIMKTYLSEVAFKTLTKYYGIEGLGLHIITQLKRE